MPCTETCAPRAPTIPSGLTGTRGQREFRDAHTVRMKQGAGAGGARPRGEPRADPDATYGKPPGYRWAGAQGGMWAGKGAGVRGTGAPPLLVQPGSMEGAAGRALLRPPARLSPSAPRPAAAHAGAPRTAARAAPPTRRCATWYRARTRTPGWTPTARAPAVGGRAGGVDCSRAGARPALGDAAPVCLGRPRGAPPQSASRAAPASPPAALDARAGYIPPRPTKATAGHRAGAAAAAAAAGGAPRVAWKMARFAATPARVTAYMGPRFRATPARPRGAGGRGEEEADAEEEAEGAALLGDADGGSWAEEDGAAGDEDSRG
jgi:hypothetical protein